MTVVGVVALAPRPPAWDLLALARAERRPVKARYRGAERVLCPHVLGWKSPDARRRCATKPGAPSATAASHPTPPNDGARFSWTTSKT